MNCMLWTSRLVFSFFLLLILMSGYKVCLQLVKIFISFIDRSVSINFYQCYIYIWWPDFMSIFSVRHLFWSMFLCLHMSFVTVFKVWYCWNIWKWDGFVMLNWLKTTTQHKEPKLLSDLCFMCLKGICYHYELSGFYSSMEVTGNVRLSFKR